RRWFGRGDREAEGTRLLSERSSKGYRGFESRPLRRDFERRPRCFQSGLKQAAIAQLDRASVYGTEGQRFESSWPRQSLDLDVDLDVDVDVDLEADAELMRDAMAEARLAEAHGDVPVGAVVVRAGAIIGRGHNRREVDADPTAHAELLAIRAA